MRARLPLAAAVLVAFCARSPADPPKPVPKDEIQISFGVQILTVSTKFPLALGDQKVAEGEAAVLTVEQARALLDVAQADPQVNVYQLARPTVLDGDQATIRTGESREFVTGLEAARVNGSAVLVPKKTKVDLGETLTIGGRASADRQTVTMHVKLVSTHLTGCLVPLIPVTCVEAGKPVVRNLQAPDVQTLRIEKDGLSIPTGESIVLVNPAEEVEERTVTRVPVLSSLPVVGQRLFTSTGYGRKTVRRLILVKPMILTEKN